MRKHDWSMLVKTQAASGQTIAAFCAARGLTRSTFYAERAKHASRALVPIRVQAPDAVTLTLMLGGKTVEVRGSATDLAQVLRCL